MATGTPPAYSHTQHAPLHLLFYALAALCLVVTALTLSAFPVSLITGAVALFMLTAALAAGHLTVADAGDRLDIRFGPLPLFHTAVPYDDIERVEVGRTLLLDGLGIHYSLRGGWVWNLWGRSCVVLHRRKGPMWIGTDDPHGLAHFLQQRLGQNS